MSSVSLNLRTFFVMQQASWLRARAVDAFEMGKNVVVLELLPIPRERLYRQSRKNSPRLDEETVVHPRV